MVAPAEGAEILNGIVASTMLGVEDHNILTAYLFLNLGSGSQGFGGWTLDGAPTNRAPGQRVVRVGTAWGMEWVRRILATLEVRTWEELPGTPCRVVRGGDGGLTGIGHFVRSQWFAPKEDLAELLPRRETQGGEE